MFGKYRKFAARWAQQFSKLIEKHLRYLNLKLATPQIHKSENLPI